MKMKTEATPAQIREVEKQFEEVVNKIDAILSRLEDEREGDIWRMGSHQPDAQKFDAITREGLDILKSGFVTIKANNYAE